MLSFFGEVVDVFGCLTDRNVDISWQWWMVILVIVTIMINVCKWSIWSIITPTVGGRQQCGDVAESSHC